jgi:PadR family transcriptional regulator PadR
VAYMAKSFKDEIVERMFRNFLDIMILKLIRGEAMWGYKMIKTVQENYGIKLRHGALYPLLNNLEKKGFIESRRHTRKGRVRKVYKITSKGMQFINIYHEFLQEQI